MRWTSGRICDLQRAGACSTNLAEAECSSVTSSRTNGGQPKDAGRRLERNALETYAPVWNVHIGPRLGHLQVRQLNAPVVQAFKERMEADGVGPPSTRRALAILQAICRYAIAKGELSSNPVREVRKPAVRRKLEIVAISPTQVESLRAALANDPAGQLIVILIAYQGLLPRKRLH